MHHLCALMKDLQQITTLFHRQPPNKVLNAEFQPAAGGGSASLASHRIAHTALTAESLPAAIIFLWEAPLPSGSLSVP